MGTGVTVEKEYPALMNKYLKQITKLDLRVGADRIQLMQSMGDVAGFSAQLRVLAIDLSKIVSDLRLMVMGPRTGIDEITLPAVQPGSSIMPGKINPSIPEMVNQVCFQVMGCDTTVAIAVGARAARAQRHDAGHRVQRAAVDAHPDQRGERARRQVREGHRGQSRDVRVLGRALGRARDGARAADRLRARPRRSASSR